MKILVTGSEGFFGSWLVPGLEGFRGRCIFQQGHDPERPYIVLWGHK